MRFRLSDEEKKKRVKAKNQRWYLANREKSLAYSAAYYQEKRKSQMQEKALLRMACKRLEPYLIVMIRYYTKEHRQRCYRQLKEDLQNMQRHLQVA